LRTAGTGRRERRGDEGTEEGGEKRTVCRGVRGRSFGRGKEEEAARAILKIPVGGRRRNRPITAKVWQRLSRSLGKKDLKDEGAARGKGKGETQKKGGNAALKDFIVPRAWGDW